MDKSSVVLNLYDRLMKNKRLNAVEVCEEYEISIATFYRYVSILRTHVQTKCIGEMIYDPVKKSYEILKTKNPNSQYMIGLDDIIEECKKEGV